MLLRGQNSIESLLDKSQVLLGRSERLACILFQVFRVTVTYTHTHTVYLYIYVCMYLVFVPSSQPIASYFLGLSQAIGVSFVLMRPLPVGGGGGVSPRELQDGASHQRDQG